MSENSGFSGGDILLAFLVGGVVGAGVALLMAPESGENVRRKIRDFADDTKSRATGYADQAKDAFNTSLARGKELYEEKKSAITSAIEAGREAFIKEKEKIVEEG